MVFMQLHHLNLGSPPSDRPYRLSKLEHLLKMRCVPGVHGGLRDGSVQDVFKLCNADDGRWSRIVVHIGTINEKEASSAVGVSLQREWLCE